MKKENSRLTEFFPSIKGLEVVFQCRDEGPVRARVRWLRPGNQPLPPGSRDVNGRLEIPNIRVGSTKQYDLNIVFYR